MAGDLLQYDSDLGQVTFRRRLMQIQPQRLAQSVRMIPQRFPQPAQRLRPEPDVARTTLGEITAMPAEERFHIFRHIFRLFYYGRS
jgi:hypothetical protein